jgi:hypothetical protein
MCQKGVLTGISSRLCAEASAHIRVQNGVFVDENCREFLFSGYNAWQVSFVFLRSQKPLLNLV